MRTIHGFWILLAAPALLMLYQFSADVISYGQTVHRSGQWSIGLLITALAVTPLQRLFGARWGLPFLRNHRRSIGVASFGYAALHTAVYLERKWGADLIIKEGSDPSLGTGWLAMLVFLLLALTSNDASVRILRRRWKTLHRFIYPATGLAFAHWILSTINPAPGVVCLALILLLEMTRFRRERSADHG